MSTARWLKAKIECSICGRTWNAIFLSSVPALECPDCGYMNTTPPQKSTEDASEEMRWYRDEDPEC